MENGLRCLTSPSVLNLSHNNMNRISLHASKLTSLKALMLNNNSILRIDNISSIKNLNTIVLSHNSITVIENIFTLPALTKLSLSHNRVRVIPDTLASLSSLRELRLAHNRILSLPSRAMSGLSALEILDLGHNLLTGWESVTALEGCLHLVNLNLLGNGVCGVGEKGAEKGKDEKGEWKKEKGGEEYREKVLGLVPTLRVLDGDRFDPKFLERREKRKGVMERKKRMEENLAKKGKTTPAGDGGASGPGRQDEARERRQRPGADGEEDGDGGEVDRPRKRPKSDNGWVVPSAIGVEESARVRDDAPKPGLKSAKKKKDDELKPTTKPGLKKDVARKSILSRKNPTSSSASTIATSTVTSDFKPLSAPAPPPFKPKPKATSFLSADDTKPQPYSKSQASLLSGEVVPDSTLGKRESSSLLDGDSLEMEKKRQARSGVVAIIEAKQPRRAVTTTTAAKVKVVKTGTPVFAAAGSGAVSVGKWD
ncbi:hypothetical protein HK101_007410 [Irineochytrium annulatum]|nr:hypothetical protein HK101_007410 [Irineochytrium annulatum]